MASNLPAITYAALIPGYTSIDQKTISIWAQAAIGAGVYAVGGIPAGLVALARSLTVDDSTFLQSTFVSELTIAATGNSYKYVYVPSTDKLQIFQVTNSSGAYSELTASAIIPAGVLTDVIVVEAIYNRL